MKIHVVFIEPANYTQDLIENVYTKIGISYSFINSNSEANNKTISSNEVYLFDRNSFFKNIRYLWRISHQNHLIIINGYNHIEFIISWIFSFFSKNFIGIESDTPYRPKMGIKGILKRIYLETIFANRRILGLPGGEFSHKDLFLNYGMPDNRIFFLPMVVNNAKFYKEIGSELSLNEALKFIFVGRLIPEKNLSMLVKSFKAVLKLGRKVNLDIIGEGICRKELEELIGNTSGIHLLGKKMGVELLEGYHDAHIMVLPSCSETWGLVINEALSAGLPVLCSSAVGAAKDLIINPGTGWVFEDNNELELTEMLINIIDHPEQIRKVAETGQEFILNHWNYDLYVRNLNLIINYAEAN